MLLQLIRNHGRHWKLIAEELRTMRTPAMVRNRFLRIERGREATEKGISKNKCGLCGQLKRGHFCQAQRLDVLSSSQSSSLSVLSAHEPIAVAEAVVHELPRAESRLAHEELVVLLPATAEHTAAPHTGIAGTINLGDAQALTLVSFPGDHGDGVALSNLGTPLSNLATPQCGIDSQLVLAVDEALKADAGAGTEVQSSQPVSPNWNHPLC